MTLFNNHRGLRRTTILVPTYFLSSRAALIAAISSSVFSSESAPDDMNRALHDGVIAPKPTQLLFDTTLHDCSTADDALLVATAVLVLVVVLNGARLVVKNAEANEGPWELLLMTARRKLPAEFRKRSISLSRSADLLDSCCLETMNLLCGSLARRRRCVARGSSLLAPFLVLLFLGAVNIDGSGRWTEGGGKLMCHVSHTRHKCQDKCQ